MLRATRTSSCCATACARDRRRRRTRRKDCPTRVLEETAAAEAAARRCRQDNAFQEGSDREAQGGPESHSRKASRRLEAGTPSRRSARQSSQGFRGTGDRQYLSRAQAWRRADRDPGRRLGEHARRNRRQRDPAAQHAGVASPVGRRSGGARSRPSTGSTSQMPPKSKFQMIRVQHPGQAAGREQRRQMARSAVTQPALNEAVTQLRKLVPQRRHEPRKRLRRGQQLSPRPDSVIHRDRWPADAGRSRHRRCARRSTASSGSSCSNARSGGCPRRIPVNVILMPMEGDPMAPTAFWALTRKTKGIFLSPARDWP